MIVLFAGLVNWLVTLIIVESELFREVRDWVDTHAPEKLRYLVHCHLCCGTWIGLALALVLPGPLVAVHPLLTWFLNGLLYKAVGHVTLEITAILKHHNALLNAAEGMTNADHREHVSHQSSNGYREGRSPAQSRNPR